MLHLFERRVVRIREVIFERRMRGDVNESLMFFGNAADNHASMAAMVSGALPSSRLLT